jgi:hypothetical protein
MADNSTGTQFTESDRTDWNPAGNGGLSQEESDASPDGIAKTAGSLTETAHEYSGWLEGLLPARPNERAKAN